MFVRNSSFNVECSHTSDKKKLENINCDKNHCRRLPAPFCDLSVARHIQCALANTMHIYKLRRRRHRWSCHVPFPVRRCVYELDTLQTFAVFDKVSQVHYAIPVAQTHTQTHTQQVPSQMQANNRTVWFAKRCFVREHYLG